MKRIQNRPNRTKTNFTQIINEPMMILIRNYKTLKAVKRDRD